MQDECRFGVIVDGYSTGAGLVDKFNQYGIRCIHVQSQRIIPKVYLHTYESKKYYEHFIFSNNPKELIEQLMLYQPEFVIPGAECGVQLADTLSNSLNLKSNDIQLSSHRRDKYLMWQAINAQGLQTIPTVFVKTLDDATERAIEQSVWPLIIKPLNSAGGEGVKICWNIDEVVQAFNEIMIMPLNMLGYKNEGVLIQHYIQGKEYVVNTVSYDGHHKLCELWEYTHFQQPNGRQIYDTANLVEFDEFEHKNILAYAFNVIKTLGIKYGPAHVEIIENDSGCYLVELGARLMGANLPFSLLEESITTPQSVFTAMAYAEPEVFLENIATSYKVKKYLSAVFMVSHQEGMIQQINLLDKLESLPSYYNIKLAVKAGSRLSKTIDYQTSPGMIYLSHDDLQIIQDDEKAIRKLEKDMFLVSKASEEVLLV